jgi:hypothetical protein
VAARVTALTAEAPSVEEVLTRLSADEIVSALRLSSAPPALQAVVRAGFAAVSSPLGRVLSRFDERVGRQGIARAAAAALEDLGARCTVEGNRPQAEGPLLVVSNHPGAYDALVLFATLGRDDVAVMAGDRAFLRAMPSVRRHLLLVPDSGSGTRARGLRRAMEHLAAGRAVLHFGCGAIEPDPAFPLAGATPLGTWQAGTGTLVRAAARVGGRVVAALVEGVHSRRAKASLVARAAEARGVTTIAPLLQVAFARYREVAATVRFAGAAGAGELAVLGDDAAIAAAVRSRALALWPREVGGEGTDGVVPPR